MNHNLTCPHAQQGGTCSLGKPVCLRHLGSSIVDQSARDWPLVAAGGLSFGWVAGVVAGVGAAAGAVIVSRSGPGGAEYAGSGVAEVVGESIGSAANTGNVSAFGRVALWQIVGCCISSKHGFHPLAPVGPGSTWADS